MSRVTADQIVLRLKGSEFLRRRVFDKRPYFTFSRGDGAAPLAAYRDRNLGVQFAAQNKLRVDWDDQLLIPGILIEGTRAQKSENSSAETDAAGWAATGGSTVVRDTTQARCGTASIKVTTANGTSSGVFMRLRSGSRMAVTATNNRLHAWGVWVYAPAASVGKTVKIRIEWWSSVPAFLTANETTGIVLVAGWQFISITAAANASAVTADVFIGGDNAQGVWDFWVDLGQFEEGAFPSTGINTDTAARTRASDLLDCRIALDMARDWSLYMYFRQFGSNLTSWPDTEPQTDPFMVSLHPDVAGTYTDNGGSLLCHRQNALAQYEWEYNSNRVTAARTFSPTPNAQKLTLRHHASDHHLSIAIDGGAFVDGAAPSGVTILPQQLLRLGHANISSAFARYFNLLLAYELHTQTELEAVA